MRTDEVFGPSPAPRDSSYVDRGLLDSEIELYLRRDVHLALRGASKCGKSWLRQRTTPDAITIQCRISKTVTDLYIDILSELDVQLVLESSAGGAIKGTATAKGELGTALLAKISGETNVGGEYTHTTKSKPAGRDVNDLKFVADLVKAAGRRLVIEDFHYLSIAQRKIFAFDLKALWDFGLFVTIIGIWNQTNMLLALNPDLSGRVHEISLSWSESDLQAVIAKGAKSLNLEFSPKMVEKLVSLSAANVGILQKLTLMALDACNVYDAPFWTKQIDDLKSIETAALEYAEQLNPLYQEFAKNVSTGIRTRKNSTGIYAHAIAVMIAARDEELINGLTADTIFQIARARQPRIQLGNLKTVLERFEELQIDSDGRGLVLAYNPSGECITVVDRQLLLYRKYCTVKWPWESLIAEVGEHLD
jgi:hypothetical protein